MLSCLLNGYYQEASRELDRTLDFLCPECHREVILKAKKGGQIIPHFAHTADSDCNHGVGETEWHRKGKLWIANYFREKGYQVQFEVALGKRRTDVLVMTPDGEKKAVEFQRKDEGVVLYKRTNDLLRYIDDVIWIYPWNVKRIDKKYRATATYGINALFSDNKKVKAKIMFFDSDNNILIRCRKVPWTRYVEQTDFGGGYDKKLSRWCELIIEKEYKHEQKG